MLSCPSVGCSSCWAVFRTTVGLAQRRIGCPEGYVWFWPKTQMHYSCTTVLSMMLCGGVWSRGERWTQPILCWICFILRRVLDAVLTNAQQNHFTNTRSENYELLTASISKWTIILEHLQMVVDYRINGYLARGRPPTEYRILHTAKVKRNFAGDLVVAIKFCGLQRN